MNEKQNDQGSSQAGAGRKHAEWAMKEGERLFSVLSQISLLGIFRTDVAGNYLYVNDRWCMIAGMKQSAVLAGGWARAIHPDDRDRVAMVLYTSKQAGLNFNLEYRILRPDGEERWVLGQAAAERNAAGEVAGYIGTITDITQFKQSEESLRKSETKHRTLYDTTTDAVMLLDEKGFFDCNKATLAMFGCATREEFCSKHPADLSPPVQPCGTGSFALANRHIATAMKNGSYSFEWVHKRADNDMIFFADVLLSAMELDGKRVLQATVRDITERKKLEEERQEALLRLQKIASQVPGVLYQFRLRPDGSACVPYASEAAREIYRLSPEEIREDASRIFAYVHPDDLEGFKASIQASARGLTPWQQEYRLKFDDGTVRWLLGNSIPQREADGSTLWHGFITDITTRKCVENEIFAVQSRLKATLEAIPDLLFEMGPDGRYYDYHSTHPELLAALPEELIGKTVHEVFSPEAADVVMLALREAGEKGSSYGRQIKLPLAQGTLWFELSVARKHSLAGKEPRFIVLSRDITERKKNEEQLKQSEEKLRAYLDNISDTIWLIDANLNMAYVSPSVTRLLGVLPEGLIGRPSALVIHPDDMGVVINAQHYVMEHPGEPHTVRYRVSHKDGRWIDVESTGVNMLGNPVIKGVLVTMRDITEHKQIEDTLRESEACQSAILNNSPYLAWLKDPEGHYLKVNKAYADYALLKDAQMVIGKTDFDFWPKELAEKYRADDAEVIALRQQKRVEEPSLDGDKIHWVETFKTPVVDQSGKILGTTGFARDITERKQAEQALAESESRFREIFNTVSDAIFIHDAETGRILDVNSRMLEMYGLAHEEALTCGPDDLSAGSPPYSSAEAIEKIHLARVDGPQTFDWLARTRDGHLFWVEVSLQFALIGSQQRILAVVRDISDRKRAEEALRESEYRWKFALEGSGDGLWDWNMADNTVFFSKRWKEMLGYSEGEISNGLDEWEKRIHPDDKAETLATVQAYLEGKTTVYQSEHRVSCKDGNWKWVLDRGMVVSRDEEGKPLRMVGTYSDITERKHAEEQIHNLAFYDTLTQLPNRRMLNDRMNQAMASSKRSSRYGALLFLDLDNFKPLNDTYGHAVGDLLLKEVARRISSCVREMDTVARFGGDEFVVMLTELDADKMESTAQAGIVAEKIRIILAEPYVLIVQQEGKAETTVEHHCTSSIGVVLFINHEDSQEDIIKWADMAMYQAKDDGRNLIRFYASRD